VRGAISDGRPYRDSWPEMGFEEIGELTMVNGITLPRSRLLARVVESFVPGITSG
jgi:hypothetical protein